ncbi:MAG: hypothetical protein GX601_09070 [Anaerolineales bacterium]|nr:hypothetical protein [Anaerolineales bacterium]
MTKDQHKLEQFLNSLEGEVIAVIPNVNTTMYFSYVDFVFIVEKTSPSGCAEERSDSQAADSPIH